MVQIIVARKAVAMVVEELCIETEMDVFEVVLLHTYLAKTWVPYSTLMACCYCTYLALMWWAL